MICIITCQGGNIYYLSYQEYDRSYFWTDKANFAKTLANNTKEHPYLFKTRREAISLLKSINIPQRCTTIEWDWTDEDEMKNPTRVTNNTPTEKNTDTARFMEYLESAIDKAGQAISSISYSSYPEINKDPITTLRQAITLMTDVLDMEIHKPIN